MRGGVGVGVLLLAAAACGGDDPGPSSTTPTTPRARIEHTTTTEATTTTEPEPDDLSFSLCSDPAGDGSGGDLLEVRLATVGTGEAQQENLTSSYTLDGSSASLVVPWSALPNLEEPFDYTAVITSDGADLDQCEGAFPG